MYLLTEQIMNGTVTMQIITTGIDAKTYNDAILKVKAQKNFNSATMLKENEFGFSYIIIKGTYPCYGNLENKVLKMI